MHPYLTVYCFVSGVSLFMLGLAWSGSNPVHRAIKYLFLFSSVWGVFFGACMIRGLI